MALSVLSHAMTVQIESAVRDPTGTGRIEQSWTNVPVPGEGVGRGPGHTYSSTTYGSGTYGETPTGLTLQGPLAMAGPNEAALYQQEQHDVIFGFVVEGPRYPRAKPGDRMVAVDTGRAYYVRGLDDVSPNGRWTIYYLSERPSGA